MASSNYLFLSVLFLSCFFTSSLATRLLTDHSSNPMLFRYHNGPLLTGKLSINLIWYGKFTTTQRAIVSDFLTSLSTPNSQQQPPSVSAWWSSDVAKYYHLANPSTNPPFSSSLASFTLAKQVLDPNYSLGKSLSTEQLLSLASSSTSTDITNNAVSVVLTSADVAVEGFCVSKCGTHGSLPNTKSTFIWVGNSETQCPGQCAWPFHQPIYGPQTPALVAPNDDVGLDGMIINLAGLLAGTVTNPFGNGYYQGPKEAPLEAASACPGVYGKGAYPGYAGELLVDKTTGASYNAIGLNGRKYLVPGLYDPITSSC